MNQRERRLRTARRDVGWTVLLGAISAGLFVWGVVWLIFPPSDFGPVERWVVGPLIAAMGFFLGVMTLWLEGTRQTRIGWWSE
jgi:hypothetical protein